MRDSIAVALFGLAMLSVAQLVVRPAEAQETASGEQQVADDTTEEPTLREIIDVLHQIREAVRQQQGAAGQHEDSANDDDDQAKTASARCHAELARSHNYPEAYTDQQNYCESLAYALSHVTQDGSSRSVLASLYAGKETLTPAQSAIIEGLIAEVQMPVESGLGGRTSVIDHQAGGSRGTTSGAQAEVSALLSAASSGLHETGLHIAASPGQIAAAMAGTDSSASARGWLGRFTEVGIYVPTGGQDNSDSAGRNLVLHGRVDFSSLAWLGAGESGPWAREAETVLSTYAESREMEVAVLTAWLEDLAADSEGEAVLQRCVDQMRQADLSDEGCNFGSLSELFADAGLLADPFDELLPELARVREQYDRWHVAGVFAVEQYAGESSEVPERHGFVAGASTSMRFGTLESMQVEGRAVGLWRRTTTEFDELISPVETTQSDVSFDIRLGLTRLTSAGRYWLGAGFAHTRFHCEAVLRSSETGRFVEDANRRCATGDGSPATAGELRRQFIQPNGSASTDLVFELSLPNAFVNGQFVRQLDLGLTVPIGDDEAPVLLTLGSSLLTLR